MARAVHKFSPATPYVVNGSWQGSFAFDGTLLQVVVIPPVPETLYTFIIKDDEGMPLFLRNDVRGTLCISELDIILFPGEKNILINSSVDGLFRVKLIYQQ